MPDKNDSTKPSLYHVDLFGESARRDPEQSEIINVSEDYNFPLRRCYLPDGREMYAVQDWISGVAKSNTPVRFWSDLKKRMKKANVHIYASCVQLPYTSTDGKTYQVDYADGQTLYGITQHMGVDTGIRNAVLSHLAKTGAFVDAARRDPEQAELAINQHSRRKDEYKGKDEAWILVRELGKVTRKQLTAIIVKLSPSANLGIVTNIGYVGTLGMDAKTLNAHLGQKPGDNPRDEMSRLALAYTLVHEEASRVRLQGYSEDEIIPESVVYQEIREVSRTIGLQARDMAAQLGIDLASGKPLLQEGRK